MTIPATGPWIVGLAGLGEIAEEAAIALLDEWMADEVTLVVPQKIPRAAKGLRAIVKWAEEEQVDVEPAEDIIGFLNGSNGYEKHTPYLVLLWDENPDSEELLDQATKAGIEVKDLCRSLDDLVFDDPDEEGPPWNEEDNAEDIVPAIPDQESVVAEIAPEATAIAPDIGKEYSSGIEDVIREFVIGIMVDEFKRAPGVYKRLLDQKQEEKVSALVNEDGEYRLATRGRPKKGEKLVELTVTEARGVGLVV